MRSFKGSLYIFQRQFIRSLFSKRIWSGYLIGIFSILVTSYNYSSFVNEHTVNVAEVFIQHYSSVSSITVSLFGLILIFSEAPFIRNDVFMMIHRAGRKRWYAAMWAYIMAQSALYYMVSFLASTFFVLPKAYMHNIWSQPLQYLNSSSKGVVMEYYHIGVPDKVFLSTYSPYTAFIHTLLLMLLYSIVLGGVLFALNLYTHMAVGTIVAAAIHVLGVLLRDILEMMLPGVRRWALVTNVMLREHLDGAVTLLFSYVLFAFLIIVVFDLGNLFIRYSEFVGIGDERDD